MDEKIIGRQDNEFRWKFVTGKWILTTKDTKEFTKEHGGIYGQTK
jgi:hypothetical protein